MKDIFSVAINYILLFIENSYLWLLLPLCLLYLFFKEKNVLHKMIFLWGTVFLFLLYMCPLSGKILYFCLGNNTYYRIFWLIPLVPLICYTATTIISQFHGIKRFSIFLFLLVSIMCCGSYMLKEPNFHEVTNVYKLPQESIDTADWIPDKATIVGADWLVPYIRQYNPTITLVNTRWQNHPIDEELKKPNPDLSILGPLLQDSECDFVAIGQDKNMTILGNWEDYGFQFYRGDNRCIIFINEKSRFYSDPCP